MLRERVLADQARERGGKYRLRPSEADHGQETLLQAEAEAEAFVSHPAWKGRLAELEAVPEARRDADWRFAFWECRMAIGHEDCQQPQCSCHAPPGTDLTKP